jgi:hypothetical protein
MINNFGRVIDWRDVTSLHDINATQALMILGEIGNHFSQPTRDSSLLEDQRLNVMDGSAEAASFADAANALGRKLRSAHDCRPTLRQLADEKRETKLDPDEEFAANAKRYHRR